MRRSIHTIAFAMPLIVVMATACRRPEEPASEAERKRMRTFVAGLYAGTVAMPAPFSDYPQFSEPEKRELVCATIVPWHVFRRHYFSANGLEGKGQFLLKMTWFAGGNATSAKICSVSSDGTCFKAYERLGWSMGDGRIWRLRSKDMRKIREGLCDLPHQSCTPPLERLLVLSYWNGQEWVTNCYDRAQPSPAVVSITKLLNYKLKTRWELKRAASSDAKACR